MRSGVFAKAALRRSQTLSTAAWRKLCLGWLLKGAPMDGLERGPAVGPELALKGDSPSGDPANVPLKGGSDSLKGGSDSPKGGCSPTGTML